MPSRLQKTKSSAFTFRSDLCLPHCANTVEVVPNGEIASYDFSLTSLAFDRQHHNWRSTSVLIDLNISPPQHSRFADTNACVGKDQNIVRQQNSFTRLPTASSCSALLHPFAQKSCQLCPIACIEVRATVLLDFRFVELNRSVNIAVSECPFEKRFQRSQIFVDRRGRSRLLVCCCFAANS